MIPKIIASLNNHLELIEHLRSDYDIQTKINSVADLITKAYKNGNKVLFCGNGGSAADAEHLACELSGRFYLDRSALFAEALHVNGAALTAISNDYGYTKVFARILESKGQSGDILFAMTTSGNSSNIHAAIDVARAKKIDIVSITGKTTHTSIRRSNIHLELPSSDTPRIQEASLLIGHIICEIVEQNLFAS